MDDFHVDLALDEATDAVLDFINRPAHFFAEATFIADECRGHAAVAVLLSSQAGAASWTVGSYRPSSQLCVVISPTPHHAQEAVFAVVQPSRREWCRRS